MKMQTGRARVVALLGLAASLLLLAVGGLLLAEALGGGTLLVDEGIATGAALVGAGALALLASGYIPLRSLA
jgi:hypothetical protein